VIPMVPGIVLAIANSLPKLININDKDQHDKTGIIPIA